MNKLGRYAAILATALPLAYVGLHATGCQTIVGATKGAVRDIRASIRYIKEPLYNSISDRRDRQREELAEIERADKARLSELEQEEEEKMSGLEKTD